MKSCKDVIFVFLTMLVFSTSCKSQLHIAVSEDMYTIHKSEFGDGIFIKGLKNYRMQSHWLDKLEYSSKNDTLYVLEHLGVQGNYNFTSWSKSDTISYTNETGLVKLTNKPLFAKKMMQLVSNWDIKGIKKEENINSNLFPNETIYATRIVFLNKKYKIDCISFKDFFNLDRDTMDFND